MNRTVYSLLILVTLFFITSCFKEYEKRYLFDGQTVVEFEDAVINSDDPGNDYPMLRIDGAGEYEYRVNFVGAQVDTPTVIHFMELPEKSTAIEGKDYEFPQGDTLVVPANSSFGWLKVRVLNTGGGSPELVIKLLGNDDIKGLERHARLGLKFKFCFTSPSADQIDSINDIVHYKDIVLGSYNNENNGGNLDLKTGNTYTMECAADNSEKVDMILMRSSSTAMNLLAPANSGVTAWSASKHIPDEWSTRNDGTFIKLSNPSGTEEDIFNDASSIDDLLDAYYLMLSDVYNRPNYDTYDGPDSRLRSIEPGDIILYYSKERSQIAIMKVGDIEPGAAGSMDVEIKTGEIPSDPSALYISGMGIGGWSKNSAFPRSYNVNLDKHEIYDTVEIHGHDAEVDMLSMWSGGGGYLNWITPAAYTSGWTIANQSIAKMTTLNDGIFVKLTNPTAQEEEVFNDLRERDELVDAFNDYESTVTTRTDYISNQTSDGPGNRVRRMEAGDIIYYKCTTPGRDLYAAMKVLEIDPWPVTNSGWESVKVVIKSHKQ